MNLAEIPYTDVPAAIDIAPYADFYRQAIRDVCSRKQKPIFAEAGVRYGCLARIIRDEMKDREYELHLMDPKPLKEALALCSDNIVMHPSTAEVAAQKLADESIDFLHIDVDYDGTHPYELTFSVLLALLPKMRRNGIIILHDCTPHFPGVVRITEEMKRGGWTAEYSKPHPDCPIAAPVRMERSVDGSDDTKISVIIPTLSAIKTRQILKNLAGMHQLPDEVILIDNAGRATDAVSKYQAKLPIKLLKQKRNIGVNASWNLGIEQAANELVLIANDDITLPPRYFECLQKAFRCYSSVGFLVPQTITKPIQGGSSPWRCGAPTDIADVDSIPNVSPLTTRDGGWCMALRKSLLEPIPSELFTFCGDDFLFYQVQDRGYWTLRMDDVWVYHEVGVSLDHGLRKKLKLPKTFEEERAIFESIRRSRWCNNS